MIHVALRILVWVVVLGVAYLAFGPQLFDSSDTANPFGRSSVLYLPPAKQPREINYETIMQERALTAEERSTYEALVQKRKGDFWNGGDTPVTEALQGVKTQRAAHLVGLLEQRGWSRQDAAVFLTVVRRDYPDLLVDRN